MDQELYPRKKIFIIISIIFILVFLILGMVYFLKFKKNKIGEREHIRVFLIKPGRDSAKATIRRVRSAISRE